MPLRDVVSIVVTWPPTNEGRRSGHTGASVVADITDTVSIGVLLVVVEGLRTVVTGIADRVPLTPVPSHRVFRCLCGHDVWVTIVIEVRGDDRCAVDSSVNNSLGPEAAIAEILVPCDLVKL